MDEKKLKVLLYTIRGLKRRLYRHSQVPTTKDPNGPKISCTRCLVCSHSAVGDADIVHHASCMLAKLSVAWTEFKEDESANGSALFDFREFFTRKEEAHVPDESGETQAAADSSPAS